MFKIKRFSESFMYIEIGTIFIHKKVIIISGNTSTQMNELCHSYKHTTVG